MRLSAIKPNPGSIRKRQRLGRGVAAGQGASCGKGMRGQKARKGGSTRPGFEGGQTPLYRRVPKLKHFPLVKQTQYSIVNVRDLNILPTGSLVTLESLMRDGIVTANNGPLKILGDGVLQTKLTVKASAFSEAAEKKIQAAGGKVIWIDSVVDNRELLDMASDSKVGFTKASAQWSNRLESTSFTDSSFSPQFISPKRLGRQPLYSGEAEMEILLKQLEESEGVNKSFVEDIRSSLAHKDPEIRSKKVFELGQLQQREYIPLLSHIVSEDSSDEVRYQALMALTKLEHNLQKQRQPHKLTKIESIGLSLSLLANKEKESISEEKLRIAIKEALQDQSLRHNVLSLLGSVSQSALRDIGPEDLVEKLISVIDSKSELETKQT